MQKKNLIEYKRKYDTYRHHAWAGGILLSLLMVIRALLEILNISNIPDLIIIPIVVILIVYILISIFFTYKYLSGLNVQQEQQIIQVKTISNKVEKNKLKLEKKKTKAEIKKQKKMN